MHAHLVELHKNSRSASVSPLCLLAVASEVAFQFLAANLQYCQ